MHKWRYLWRYHTMVNLIYMQEYVIKCILAGWMHPVYFNYRSQIMMQRVKYWPFFFTHGIWYFGMQGDRNSVWYWFKKYQSKINFRLIVTIMIFKHHNFTYFRFFKGVFLTVILPLIELISKCLLASVKICWPSRVPLLLVGLLR